MRKICALRFFTQSQVLLVCWGDSRDNEGIDDVSDETIEAGDVGAAGGMKRGWNLG